MADNKNPIAVDASDLVYYDKKIKEYIDEKIESVKTDVTDERIDSLETVTAVHEAELKNLKDHIDENEAAILVLQRDDKILAKQISDIKVSLENKVDENALENYASKEFVLEKIAEAELADKDVDLSLYYTKTETDALIADAVNKIVIPDTSNLVTREEFNTVQEQSASNSVLIRQLDDELFAVNEKLDNIPAPEQLVTIEYVQQNYVTNEQVGETVAQEVAANIEVQEAIAEEVTKHIKTINYGTFGEI